MHPRKLPSARENGTKILHTRKMKAPMFCTQTTFSNESGGPPVDRLRADQYLCLRSVDNRKRKILLLKKDAISHTHTEFLKQHH
jgi:hypothetical protein